MTFFYAGEKLIISQVMGQFTSQYPTTVSANHDCEISERDDHNAKLSSQLFAHNRNLHPEIAGFHHSNHIRAQVVCHLEVSIEIWPHVIQSKHLLLHAVTNEQLVSEIAFREIDYCDTGDEFAQQPNNYYNLKLGFVSDVELLNEARRKSLLLHAKVDADLVKEYYLLGSIAGHGSSGYVRICKHRATRLVRACKVVLKDGRMNDLHSMSTEISIVRRLSHSNIVSAYEVFESPCCFWLIMEWADSGDLHTFVNMNRARYSGKLAAEHFYQILLGINYLHSICVVHRDLKLENILLKNSKNGGLLVKISDFGLSAVFNIVQDGYHDNLSSKRKSFKGLCDCWGTPEYRAPELINGAYGPQIDIWAAGCMLYELLCGNKAFAQLKGETDLRLLDHRISQGQIERNPKKSNWWKQSKIARTFIYSMIEVNPEKRITANEALSHKWIKSYIQDYSLSSEAKALRGTHHAIEHSASTSANVAAPSRLTAKLSVAVPNS